MRLDQSLIVIPCETLLHCTTGTTLNSLVTAYKTGCHLAPALQSHMKWTSGTLDYRLSWPYLHPISVIGCIIPPHISSIFYHVMPHAHMADYDYNFICPIVSAARAIFSHLKCEFMSHVNERGVNRSIGGLAFSQEVFCYGPLVISRSLFISFI